MNTFPSFNKLTYLLISYVSFVIMHSNWMAAVKSTLPTLSAQLSKYFVNNTVDSSSLTPTLKRLMETSPKLVLYYLGFSLIFSKIF